MRTVCITGMHRSGTSVAARTLEILGLELGDPSALMGPGPDNRAGYWENRYIKELDDEVLARLGGSWDCPPVLIPGWEVDPALDDLRRRATDLLDATFGPVEDRPAVGGWKDPRLSLLLPFWRTVHDIDATVVVVRDPADVAASLGTRNGIDPTQAAVLWLRYLYAATDADPSCLLVDNRSFFDDLAATAQRLTRHLGLPSPDAEAVAAASAGVDPTLQHHRGTATRWQGDDNPVTEMADAVWAGGEVDPTALSDGVAEAIAQGWLRPPADGEQLAQARAAVVDLTERLRKRRREREQEQAARERRG